MCRTRLTVAARARTSPLVTQAAAVMVAQQQASRISYRIVLSAERHGRLEGDAASRAFPTDADTQRLGRRRRHNVTGENPVDCCYLVIGRSNDRLARSHRKRRQWQRRTQARRERARERERERESTIVYQHTSVIVDGSAGEKRELLSISVDF